MGRYFFRVKEEGKEGLRLMGEKFTREERDNSENARRFFCGANLSTLFYAYAKNRATSRKMDMAYTYLIGSIY